MINYGRQHIDKNDIKSVINVLKSDFLTQGPVVEKFEDKIKNYLGSKYCCAVSNGTAALHLACLAIDVKKEDLIITTPMTFLAGANAILYNQAKPIFIDIDPINYCIDLIKLEKKIIQLKKKGKKIKAAIITDFAGQACDWKKIKKLSLKYKFFTINDNCHSLGAKYYNDTKYATKYADIVTQSFHPVKVITTGEGGSVSTNNKRIIEKVRILRTHGLIKTKKLIEKHGNWFYQMNDLGFNYRLSDINSALGISQLKKINKILKKRRDIAKFYDNYFKDKSIFITPQIEKYNQHAYHIYPLQIRFDKLRINKKIFFKKLLKFKIKLQVHYIPIHLQKYYKKKFNYKRGSFPVSEKFYNNTVSLPIFYNLKKSQLKHIVNRISFLCK